MPPKPDQETRQQPGADRFWGQFSQSKAGRTTGAGSGNGTGRAAGDDQAGAHDAHCLEWCPICRSAELFRTAVSPELRQQAESIQHEAMGVLKAFLDAYADKAGEPGTQSGTPPPEQEEPPTRVTDIPLD